MSLNKFDPLKHKYKWADLTLEDKWMISKTNMVVDELAKILDAYELPKFPDRLEDFILNDVSRWYTDPIPYPPESVHGPMVALTDEDAGSDGDIFSHGFKLLGLGPLIGKRTWGGVIGIWPRHSLVDGTATTQPEFSYWFEDVGWGVENYGTDPDIDVDITPQEYTEGKDTQLERGIEEIQKLLAEDPPKIPEFKDRPDLTLPKLPKREG